jgi:hypothetical protein
MLRKLLLIAAAVAMPVGVIAATAGTASAAKVTDTTGPPATASCTTSGGTLTFKVPIGIVTTGGYQAPVKNKGNQIKVAGVNLNCTSSAVSQGAFTGVLSGKIKTSNPGDTPAQEYSCTGLVGVSPAPGGTLSGALKIKWNAPAGTKFSEKKSAIVVTSISGGVNMAGQGTFTIPGNPGTGSISGGFPGSDAGASSTSTDATADTESQLATQCQSTGGLSTINLGSGNASLQ